LIEATASEVLSSSLLQLIAGGLLNDASIYRRRVGKTAGATGGILRTSNHIITMSRPPSLQRGLWEVQIVYYALAILLPLALL
jgi:hypothetical protein